MPTWNIGIECRDCRKCLNQASSRVAMDMNPYAPAAAPRTDDFTVQPSDHPIRFGGVVTRADVAQYGYSRIGTLIAALLLLIGTLLCVATALGLALSMVTSELHVSQLAVSFIAVSGMVCLLVLPPLWLLSRFRGLAYARLLEKWSPRIIGPVAGKLEHELLELVYPHSRTVAPLQSLTGVRTASQYIALSYDHRQMQVCILPRHLFEHDAFQRASEQLAPWAAERPLKLKGGNSFDHRLQDEPPLELLPVPDDGIAFSGTLLFSDFTSTPVYRRQVRAVYVFFAKLAVGAVIGMLLVAAIFWQEKPFVYTFGGATLAVFLFSLTAWMIAYLRTVPNREQRIANVSGWFSEHGLAYNTAIGSSIFQLAAFEQIDSDEQSVQLILPGQFKQAVLLVDRMFPSADAFQRVRRTLTSGGPSASFRQPEPAR